MENLHVFLTQLDRTGTGKYPWRPRLFPDAAGWLTYGNEQVAMVITNVAADAERLYRWRLSGASEQTLTYSETVAISQTLESFWVPGHWVNERLTEQRFVRLLAGILSFWNMVGARFKSAPEALRPTLRNGMERAGAEPFNLNTEYRDLSLELRQSIEDAAARFDIKADMLRETLRLRDLMYAVAMISAREPYQYYKWKI